MDIPVNFNLHQVLFVQVGLSILASASVSPSYNLPIHLYGLYNVDNDLNHFPGASDGLRQYSILLILTFGLDLIWMYNWSNSTSSLPFLLILIGLVIKPISLITCLAQLNRTHGTTGFSQAFVPFAASSSMPQPHAPQHHHQGSPNRSRGFQRDSNQGSNYRSSPQNQNPSMNPTRPGPSSVSHQAQSAQIIHPNPTSPGPRSPMKAYHEFDLDSDAQNLSDDDLKFAKQELENRIAQKQQQQQQQQSNQSNALHTLPTQLGNLQNSAQVEQQQEVVGMGKKDGGGKGSGSAGYHTLE